MGIDIEYKIIFLKKAGKDILKIKKSGNKSDRKNIDIFLKEIKLNPRMGIGHPERLKYRNGEVWSRTINKKDRFVYEIFEDKILIEVQSA